MGAVVRKSGRGSRVDSTVIARTTDTRNLLYEGEETTGRRGREGAQVCREEEQEVLWKEGEGEGVGRGKESPGS